MALRAFKGKYPQIGNDVYIDDSAVVIGDVILSDDVSIWPAVVVRGDVESIAVGEGTNVQDGSVLHVTHAGEFTGQGYPLNIGKHVTVGHKAVVHACTVGDYCLVGIGAIIMDGVVLEDYVMLGAGALVSPGKRLAGGYLYVGAPARQIRPLTDAEKRFLEYSAQQYVHLKNAHIQENSR